MRRRRTRWTAFCRNLARRLTVSGALPFSLREPEEHRHWTGEAATVGQEIAAVALVVRDYDEAIAYFTGCLRFTVVEDAPLAGGKRWVLVRPPGGGTALVLARAVTPEQAARIGDQTGGRVFLFLRTDDFWRDYHDLRSRGLRFAEEPRDEVYGTVAVFLDLYGNRWDLVQQRHAEPIAAPDQAGSS